MWKKCTKGFSPFGCNGGTEKSINWVNCLTKLLIWNVGLLQPRLMPKIMMMFACWSQKNWLCSSNQFINVGYSVIFTIFCGIVRRNHNPQWECVLLLSSYIQSHIKSKISTFFFAKLIFAVIKSAHFFRLLVTKCSISGFSQYAKG